MLTQVEVFSPGVSSPNFPVDGDASSDPIQIRNIDGLSPVAAAVNTTQYGSVDGEFYTGSYVGKRNIVMTVGLNPNWADQTIEALRRILYSYFMPGGSVKLRFTSSHMPTVRIAGYVESMEPNIFAKDPELQISIICPSPYFVAETNSSATGYTTDFSDPTTTDIEYEGDVAVGYTLDIAQLDGGAVVTNGEVRIINNTPNLQIFSVKTANIDSGHFLRVSTVKGDKYVRQYPNSGTLSPVNLLGKVTPGSIWAPLAKGTNRIQIMTPTPTQTWTLSYYALYGGL